MARKLLLSFPTTTTSSPRRVVRDDGEARLPVLFRDEPRTLARARSVGERVYELSQFLVDVLA